MIVHCKFQLLHSEHKQKTKYKVYRSCSKPVGDNGQGMGALVPDGEQIYPYFMCDTLRMCKVMAFCERMCTLQYAVTLGSIASTFNIIIASKHENNAVCCKLQVLH